jgi:HEAT repeat protein
MPKRPDPTADALRALSKLREQPESERGPELARHLRSKSNWVVAKAAKIAAELHENAAIPELVAAFHRLLADPMHLDKGCMALTEIAAALYALDHYDSDLLFAGIRHTQLEGGFGTPTDTAVQLRSHCAMGLAQTHHPDAPFELVRLLADPEAGARVGAVRAIGMLPSEAAALLLRFKVLTGDPEVEVVAECFANLLACDPARSLPFVAGYCDDSDEAIAEAAVLALGDSRLPEAVEALKERWAHFVVGPMKKILLLALAAARRESSVEFLLKLLAEENPRSALDVLHALRIYKHDEAVWKTVNEIVSNRGDRALMDRFLALAAGVDR